MYFISLTTHIILVCNVILNPTIYKCYMACQINTRSQQKKTFRQKPYQSDTACSLCKCSVRVKTLRRPPAPPRWVAITLLNWSLDRRVWSGLRLTQTAHARNCHEGKSVFKTIERGYKTIKTLWRIHITYAKHYSITSSSLLLRGLRMTLLMLSLFSYNQI